MALASTWSINCWGMESAEKGLQWAHWPIPYSHADACYGLPLGQGIGLGEHLVWPYREQFRSTNATCLLSCVCKAAPTTYSSQARANRLLLSDRGLALLLVTGAGTTIRPMPVLVALGQSERESLSVPVCSGKFLVFFSVSSTCPGMWRMSPCGFPPVAAGQYSRVSLWSMARMEQICNIFPESLTAVGWVPLQQLCKNQKIKTEIWSSCPARAEAGSGTYRSWPLAHPLYGSWIFIAWSQQHLQVEIPHDCERGYSWHWSDISHLNGFPHRKQTESTV